MIDKLLIRRDAAFSECRKYRYVLTREWGSFEKPAVMCIGLNPSNGNHLKDDPTIRILIKTLEQLGFGELRMCNLYSLISSKPSKLFKVPDALGMNDEWLQSNAYGVQEIIFCWGSFKNISYRAKKVIEMFPDGKCFGKNKDGSPIHPMQLMYSGTKIEDVKLIKYL